MSLIIGTRASILASTQTELVKKLLLEAFPDLDIEICLIKSEGDVSQAPLSEIGGRGVFTAHLSQALLEKKIDCAVHSLKDLPTAENPGLTLGAILEREDARDVLIASSPQDKLPEGSLIGTGSLRRRAQLMQLRPDLKFEEIRGNVHTRIQKVLDGRYKATLLAQAGLNRLETLSDQPPSVTLGETLQIFPFSIEDITPAVAQAAIGIECRSDDEKTCEFLSPLDHKITRQAVTLERRMLNRLGGGCQVPFAAHVDSHKILHLVVANESGFCQRLRGPMAEADALMDQLLINGQQIIDSYLK
jgi:hydroxymethylbilane synthase